MHILHPDLHTFPEVLTGEFVDQSKASFTGDHFLYSHDLNVLFRDDIVGRNLMLVTLRVLRVKRHLQIILR